MTIPYIFLIENTFVLACAYWFLKGMEKGLIENGEPEN
jgi:hypothetical protein